MSILEYHKSLLREGWKATGYGVNPNEQILIDKFARNEQEEIWIVYPYEARLESFKDFKVFSRIK